MFLEDTEENESKKRNIDELQNSVEEFARLNPEASLNEYLNSVTLSSDTDEINDGNYVTLATIHAVKGLEYKGVFICGMDSDIFPLQRASDSEDQMEEERRLMYVAITRARERLYITRAKSRYVYGARKPQLESIFLKELAPKLGKAERQEGYGERNSFGNFGGRSSFSQGGGYNNGFSHQKSYSFNNYESESDSSHDYGESNSYAQSFKTAKSYNAPKPEAKDFSAYRSGVKVKHAKFGEGVIIATKSEGQNLVADVAFKSVGVKSLAVAYAPIEIIDKK